MGQRKLFCQYGPVCYRISLGKEYTLRWLRDWMGHDTFAARRQAAPLPYMVQAHRSLMVRPLVGVDLQLQKNKVRNLQLAAPSIDGLLIHPGETFSFWKRVGHCTAKKGYLEGLALANGKPVTAVGGGLCQLANLIHWLVLQSPLTVTELHHHTDAIFPDSGRRVPFGTGTSVFYNNVDYRFYNATNETFQLRIWLEEGDLCGELRSDQPQAFLYRIEERDHHYSKEPDGYYRNSEIWKKVIRRQPRQVVSETMIFKNHSRVLFDPALIPPEEIR